MVISRGKSRFSAKEKIKTRMLGIYFLINLRKSILARGFPKRSLTFPKINYWRDRKTQKYSKIIFLKHLGFF